ncbi:sugar ABC transporter permease [Marinomonas sp. CT5]|uniref:carbohydrate ABC transporter permease n=1 Tax=Marinomonas sp. CT5 TaxID=2066133 RepID=UPI001BB04F97|nr:sugar ABC transporter permease [Marinomonas sp. CT5]QUX94038.1 sugar ABC transporter permease [Marinomonas sp. CT5]
MKKNSVLAQHNKAGWIFATPGFSLMVLFIVVPFILAIVFSMTNQRLMSPNKAEYVGFENYANMLDLGVLVVGPKVDANGSVLLDKNGEVQYPKLRKFTRNNPDYPNVQGMKEWFSFTWGDKKVAIMASDLVFLKALINTFTFVLFVAPLQGALALVLALLINQPLRGIHIFRSIYFMPVVVSIVVVSLLWRFIYDGQNGLLNNALSTITFGYFEPVDWLGNPDTALGSIMAMSIWQAVGFHMIIWLSGLQTISPTLYEAAKIEGASSWQTFRFITWPGLRNTAVLVLIVITMQAFSLFAQIDVMTNGGPLDSTQTIVYQTVERGYGKQDISGGSAMSVVLFLIVLSISLFQRYLTREKN